MMNLQSFFSTWTCVLENLSFFFSSICCEMTFEPVTAAPVVNIVTNHGKLLGIRFCFNTSIFIINNRLLDCNIANTIKKARVGSYPWNQMRINTFF